MTTEQALLLGGAVIVAAIAVIVFTIIWNPKGNDTAKATEDDNKAEFDTANAIFSSHRINYDGMEFQSAEINVVFGSAQLDLRKAIIEGDCKVHTNSIFGGVSVLVPENVNVKINGSGIFGGVSDKTTHREGAPTIYIKSNFVFGGVSIK